MEEIDQWNASLICRIIYDIMGSLVISISTRVVQIETETKILSLDFEIDDFSDYRRIPTLRSRIPTFQRDGFCHIHCREINGLRQCGS